MPVKIKDNMPPSIQLPLALDRDSHLYNRKKGLVFCCQRNGYLGNLFWIEKIIFLFIECRKERGPTDFTILRDWIGKNSDGKICNCQPLHENTITLKSTVPTYLSTYSETREKMLPILVVRSCPMNTTPFTLYMRRPLRWPSCSYLMCQPETATTSIICSSIIDFEEKHHFRFLLIAIHLFFSES